MKPGPRDGTIFTLPATGSRLLRSILVSVSGRSPWKRGVEVEHGVDSAAQVHVDEREHGCLCRVSLIEYAVGVKLAPLPLGA
jgi:hypothetical protein